ncbi:hypothetical protein NGM99_13660 [Mesorhizobium sp. RP14(2022)]|uniref:Uncharacterized protein n=1 Tax=Mesorhizobium liriopis TaxID=2953882 RepID=A0ABT1C9G5_9HYPH|nr:hypothetical protein [Mesorhizobium liriopis]MCO6050825.1 hypothetical protein [Mesorhizobium liriopis]
MTEPTLLVRVYRGIADHFPIRWTEWAMLWPTFGLYIGLQFQPNMFSTSPSFADLASWGSEAWWSFAMGVAMILRFAALFVNGTFRNFEFSPHIRAGASLFGVLMWSQFSLGFLTAFVFSGGAFSGFVGWSTMVVLELMNTWRSWLDVGKQFPKA